jgi:hypothetical protein
MLFPPLTIARQMPVIRHLGIPHKYNLYNSLLGFHPLVRPLARLRSERKAHIIDGNFIQSSC